MSGTNIIVLDIGKTNKKLFVYDHNLNCLNPRESGIRIDPVRWEHPSTGAMLACEDIESLRAWMLKGLKSAADQYGEIGAISISAHGATLALLGDENGMSEEGDGLVFPVLSYENDIGAEMDAAFYQNIGMDFLRAQEATATPRLAWLINSAKAVFYLKKTMPERFRRVSRILMLPQYLGYLLCGEIGIEPTYVGCHSYLLDSSGNEYSRVAEKLGIIELLPALPMRNTWDVLGAVRPSIASAAGLPADCIVTMGAHDSNAALVPYLAKRQGDFVVQDSGTWVVTMAPLPGRDAVFAEEEIGLEVLYNRDIYGEPVKTTIFRGGAEFDFYRNNVLTAKQHPQSVSEDIVREIVEGGNVFSLPTIERGAGLFPDSRARLLGVDTIFRDATTAWHAVDIGLALQGWHALRMAAGKSPERVFIEGNIAKHNPLYRRTIATLFSNTDVCWGSMGGAPFGAAILGIAALEGARPEDISHRYDIKLQKVKRLDVDQEALKDYAEKFIAYVSSSASSPSRCMSG